MEVSGVFCPEVNRLRMWRPQQLAEQAGFSVPQTIFFDRAGWRPRAALWRPVHGQPSRLWTAKRSSAGRAALTFAEPWAGRPKPRPTP